MVRAVPESLDVAIVDRIERRLSTLAAEHRVAIPWAVESGSRAWGFPSPDSDYDCRFFFVRRADDYLSPWPARDVLEVPIEDAMDLNGWDLLKAVRLLVQGNPTVVEWLRSPIVYTGEAGFRDEFLALAEVVADRQRFARHYLHVARRHWERAVGEDGQARLKTLMYVVRAVASLRWLRLHPDGALPPMNLAELVEGSALPDDAQAELAALVSLKSRTREMGRGAVPPALGELVAHELADEADPERPRGEPRRDAEEAATRFFRSAVRRFAPS